MTTESVRNPAIRCLRSRHRPLPRRPGATGAGGEVAADYLEGLLDIADLDGDIDMDVEGERAVVSIVATENEGTPAVDLTRLVGPSGEVLDALQELTRLAVHQALGNRSRPCSMWGLPGA